MQTNTDNPLFKATVTALQTMLAAAEPQVCQTTDEPGLDVFFSRGGRRVLLCNDAKEAFPQVAQVGSLSVRTLDEAGNPMRINCKTGEPCETTGGAWWNIGLVETSSNESATEGVGKLMKMSIPAAVLSDVYPELKGNAKKCLEAIKTFIIPNKGLEVEGHTRQPQPRYSLDKLAIIYHPSGGPNNPSTVWTNQNSQSNNRNFAGQLDQ